LSWFVAGLVGIAVAATAGAGSSQEADPGVQAAERARIPLAEIAGAEAPPMVAIVPLEQVPKLQATVAQARAWIEDGRFQDAVDALLGALQDAGGDRHEVHYLLAVAKTRLGQFSAARASAEAAVRLGHGDADAHYLLAQIYRGQGENEAALAHYRSTTLAADRELNNPKITRAWHSLGRLLEQMGYDLAAAEAYARFDTALWQTHTEQRLAPEFVALLVQHPHGMVPRRARLLEQLGRSDEALGVAEWAHEIWPADLSIDRLYAAELISAGRPEQAFAFCRARLDDPHAAGALLSVAVEAARAAGRLSDWLDEVVAGIAEGRGVEPARRLPGLLADTRESAEAVRVGQALLAHLPADAEIAWEVAAARHAAGDLRGALETLAAFVRGNPDLAELPLPRLAEWSTWIDSGTSIAELIKELRAGPQADFATDFVLGVSALAADEPTLADELLRSCVAARPDFAPAYVARGEMLLASYQWEAARQYAEGLLDEHPELVAAHHLLARAQAGLDQNESAEQAYKQAIKRRPEEPTYNLALAQHYRRLGNLRGAQRYFQQALAHAPGDGDALEGLIDCYLRGGKIEIARAQLDGLDRATVPTDSLRRIDTLMRFVADPFGPEHLAELQLQHERYPDDVATARLLAGGLHYRGRLDEARRVIEQARATHPGDYHLAVLLANGHSQRGEFDQAVAALTTLAARFPNRLAVLQPLALAELNDFCLEPGRARLRRLIERDPDEADSYRGKLLMSYTELGECDQPLRLLDEWGRADPDNEMLTHQRIEVLIGCGRHAEAFALVEQRLAERPNDLRRMGEYVDYGERAEQYQAVAARLREWSKENPSSAELTEKLIDNLILAEQPDEALEVAREFEGTYAESFQRRIWLGRCAAAQGEIDTAVSEFDALLGARGPERDVRLAARQQIFITLQEAGRYDQMLERCATWLQEPDGPDRPSTTEVLLYKRFALQSAGRDAECAEVMEALLPFSPGAVGILNDLGYTWVDLGVNLERATSMIKAAVGAEPWNAAYLDSLGWAYYKTGDFSNAREYLGRAVRLRDGRDPVVYDHLADAAYRLGDPATAREYWNQAVALLQTALSEREQTRLTDQLATVRAKLAALEHSETPVMAPTAAEQNQDQDRD
jgi:tetratricopeptide (TPR) repeat protein